MGLDKSVQQFSTSVKAKVEAKNYNNLCVDRKKTYTQIIIN